MSSLSGVGDVVLLSLSMSPGTVTIFAEFLLSNFSSPSLHLMFGLPLWPLSPPWERPVNLFLLFLSFLATCQDNICPCFLNILMSLFFIGFLSKLSFLSAYKGIANIDFNLSVCVLLFVSCIIAFVVSWVKLFAFLIEF